jgi:hypothetical protein
MPITHVAQDETGLVSRVDFMINAGRNRGFWYLGWIATDDDLYDEKEPGWLLLHFPNPQYGFDGRMFASGWPGDRWFIPAAAVSTTDELAEILANVIGIRMAGTVARRWRGADAQKCQA